MEITGDFNLDARHVLTFLNENLNVTRQYIGLGLKVSSETQNIFKLSLEESQRCGRKDVDSSDLLMAIFQDRDNLPPSCFKVLD